MTDRPSRAPAGGPAVTQRRSAAIAEAAVVVALGLGAMWLIRTQTAQGPVLGLPPAFLPTVCAVAIIALALIGLAVRLWRPEPLPSERPLPSWPAAMLLAVAIAGALVLQLAGGSSLPVFAGPFGGGLVIVSLGLVLLGERRAPVLIGTLAGAVVVLGVALQVWR